MSTAVVARQHDASSSSEIKHQRHIPELDGLRGVAILMVFIGHAMKHPLLAVAGVSLFFVLSGFLISGILLRSVRKPHYFMNFYVRRSLRIWPLYYLVLAVTFLTPLFRFPHSPVPAWRYVLYIRNFWVMKAAPPILGPTWSLAIEEQFYLVWPLVVWLCGRSEWVAWVSMGLIVASPACRVLYHLHGVDPYAMTLGRLDGLAAGALLACFAWRHPARRRQLWFLGACLFVSAVILPMLSHEVLRKAFKDTSSNALFLALVGFTFLWSGTRLTAVLRTSVLRFFGTISYCLYLVHLPLYYRFSLWIAMPLAVAIATASFYLFERPILRLKDRWTRVDKAA